MFYRVGLMKHMVWGVLLALGLASGARAADDGQTKPRISYASLSAPNSSADIIPLTNGPGNIKGVHCLFEAAANVTLRFQVNGANLSTVTLQHAFFPTDAKGHAYSGWIPYNLRFAGSIRVEMQRPAGGPLGKSLCAVSWGVD